MAHKMSKTGLITNLKPNSSISEQFRTLRANIYFTSNNHKTLVITSPGYREGKSTITTNLAISMAQKGDRVLVIDADLRKPSIHSTLKVDNTIGLTNILNGEITFQEAIKQSEIDRVDVLPSGPIPINPTDLLGFPIMKEFLEWVVKRYDVALFDSSPILESTDSRILANQCEGVLLVIQCDKTEKQKALESKRQLQLAKANLDGIILNQKI